MPKSARRVTEAEALGKVDQTEDLTKKYAQTVGPVSYIPATKLDDIRLEAYYETTYRNSHEEEQVLRAVDNAVSAWVQRAAQANAERTMHLLETEEKPAMVGPRQRPNALAKAEAHLDELAKIRRELRLGKSPTPELAARYERVRQAIKARDGHSLVALRNKAQSLQEKLADPSAAIGKTLSLMQTSNWPGLGVRHW